MRTENRFDDETAVVSEGDHRYRAQTSRPWWGNPGPHGGHLAASMLRAICLEAADAELAPRTFTIHFTSRAEEGDLLVEARIERQGGSLATISCRITQQGRLIALGLAALARGRVGPELSDLRPPAVPPPEELGGLWGRGRGTGSAPSAMDNYDYRFAIGRPFSGGPARAGGWIRPKQPRAMDALLLTALSDLWMPAVFMSLDQFVPVATVELTINLLTELPVPGAMPDDWYVTVFDTPAARSGYFREEGQIWTKEGTLLASCSQLGVFLPNR